MFELEYAGHNKDGRSFEVRTRTGAFAGIISERYGKHCRVWFNSSATKGSARKFASVQEAADYLLNRRVKKGWGV